MSVSSCALLFFSSSYADEMKKKKKKIRRSKWVLVTLSGLRANDRWLMLADFRILFHYICASSLFRYICLTSPAVFSFSFVWQVEVVARALLSQSDPITCLHTCANTSSFYCCYCQCNGKNNFIDIPICCTSHRPAFSSRRVYVLVEN